jgi:hypothetical protein
MLKEENKKESYQSFQAEVKAAREGMNLST